MSKKWFLNNKEMIILDMTKTNENNKETVEHLRKLIMVLEEEREERLNNRHEVLMIDIALGRISEILLDLEVMNIEHVDLDICNTINNIFEYLNDSETLNIVDGGIVLDFNRLMYKPLRKHDEDVLRNEAVNNVKDMVDSLNKEELQKLIERINDVC